MNSKQMMPRRGILEEIGNAVTHGVGSLFAIFALILMLINSETNIEIISSVIYFVGMFMMFTMSCLYHAFKTDSKVKRLFRRFDYLSIYSAMKQIITSIPYLKKFVIKSLSSTSPSISDIFIFTCNSGCLWWWWWRRRRWWPRSALRSFSFLASLRSCRSRIR